MTMLEHNQFNAINYFSTLYNNVPIYCYRIVDEKRKHIDDDVNVERSVFKDISYDDENPEYEETNSLKIWDLFTNEWIEENEGKVRNFLSNRPDYKDGRDTDNDILSIWNDMLDETFQPHEYLMFALNMNKIPNKMELFSTGGVNNEKYCILAAIPKSQNRGSEKENNKLLETEISRVKEILNGNVWEISSVGYTGQHIISGNIASSPVLNQYKQHIKNELSNKNGRFTIKANNGSIIKSDDLIKATNIRKNFDPFGRGDGAVIIDELEKNRDIDDNVRTLENIKHN